MIAESAVTPDRIRPLRRVEYDALVESGAFADARVELLLGMLIEMSPHGPRHAEVVTRLSEQLSRALPRGVRVRVQSPLAVGEDSEPEPDIAVVEARDYSSAHPISAFFVVEVAQASVVKDRGVKAALYARAGILEFWLVNLAENVVEVHRRPVSGRYEQIERIASGGTLVPDAFPTVRIAADEILRS